MRVLLVIPKRDAYSILPAPDIGIAYVARAALNTGAEVEVLDAHKDGIDPEKFREVLEKEHYDLIGIKCLSIDIYRVFAYCQVIKEFDRSIITILGGPHPTALSEDVIKSEVVDYVIVGEGEIGISTLLKNLMANNGKIPSHEMGKIPCLGYKDRDSKVKANPIAFENELDKLGFPAWHLFKIEDYPTLPGSGGKFLPVITSRGCPSQCTFCLSNSIHGRNVRTRSPEHVIEEIKWITKDFDIQKVSILDNNFTFYKNHALTFSELYIKNKIPLRFEVSQGVRLDRIDKDMIAALERAGCDLMGVGVESGSQETLNIVNKGTTLPMIEEKLKLIKENSNIELTGFFILGFPHETEEMILETINFAVKLPLDYAAFTLFTPFPGTALFDQMIKENYFSLKSLNWEDLLLDKPTFKHRNISMDRLKKLQRKAYIKFYFRASKIKFFFRIIFQEASFISYLRRFISILKK